METKHCTKCKTTKERSEFNRDRTQADGLGLNCRECRRAYAKAWYAKLDADARKDRLSRKGRSEWQAAYYRANREKFRAYAKKALEENPQAHREHTKRAMQKRRATPKGRLESNVSRAVNRALRGRKDGEPSFKLLGFTLSELIAHLERQFLPGMSWDNYGKWHVDHIVPLAAHTYQEPNDPEFRRAWALTNLRPLWATENISKGARRLLLI